MGPKWDYIWDQNGTIYGPKWDYIWTKIEKKLRKGLFRSNFVSDLSAIDS